MERRHTGSAMTERESNAGKNDILGSSMEIHLEAKDLPNMDVGSLSDPFAVIDRWEGDEWVEFGTYSCIIPQHTITFARLPSIIDISNTLTRFFHLLSANYSRTSIAILLRIYNASLIAQ